MPMTFSIGAALRARLLAMANSELVKEVANGSSSAVEDSLEASSLSDLERLWVAMMSCCEC